MPMSIYCEQTIKLSAAPGSIPPSPRVHSGTVNCTDSRQKGPGARHVKYSALIPTYSIVACRASSCARSRLLHTMCAVSLASYHSDSTVDSKALFCFTLFQLMIQFTQCQRRKKLTWRQNTVRHNARARLSNDDCMRHPNHSTVHTRGSCSCHRSWSSHRRRMQALRQDCS